MFLAKENISYIPSIEPAIDSERVCEDHRFNMSRSKLLHKPAVLVKTRHCFEISCIYQGRS